MTEMEPTTNTATHLDQRIRYAQALASADLLPAAYRRKPANVLLAMEYGQALGLDTITAIQSVHVIDGKPTASAQLIGALVRRAGHKLRITGDDTQAVAEIVRSDDPDYVFRSVWTLDRAQRAGLVGKGVWRQYPSAMLKARAITEVARDACPEALAGVAYTPEELGGDNWPSITIEQTESDQPETVEQEQEQIEIAEVVDLPKPKPASEKQIGLIRKMIVNIGGVDDEMATALIRELLQDYEATFETLSMRQASDLITILKSKEQS